jgi:hypothetical protein
MAHNTLVIQVALAATITNWKEKRAQTCASPSHSRDAHILLMMLTAGVMLFV